MRRTAATPINGGMTDTLASGALGALYGAALGAVFLAILWFSVRQGIDGGKPGWMIGGMLARLAIIAAAGYALVATGADAAEIIGVAIGFTIIRLIVVSRTRSAR